MSPAGILAAAGTGAAGPQAEPGAGLPSWLLELLSIDPARIQGGTEHFRFARFPEGVLGLLVLLLVAGAVAFVFWNYGREGAVPRARKAILAALRSALVIAAAIILFYPVLEVDRAQELRASTLVLIDDSLSLGIRDRYRGDPARRDAAATFLGLAPEEVASLRRADLVERALALDDLRFLRELASRNQLKAYAFSSLPLKPLLAEGPPPASAPAETPPGRGGGAAAPPQPSLRLEKAEPRGSITDIAGALRSAIEAEGGAKVAGIVLITDGRVTAGEDLKGAAALLEEKGIPVHTVGVGDPTPTRNFRAATVLANERVFTGDPVVVDVRIEQHGFDGETVRVELAGAFAPEGEAPRPPAAIDVQEAAFPAGRSETTVSFRFEPNEVGRHRLTARIEARPEESFADDNERSVTIEVLREASKVLLISGGPSYEYRFLKNLLRRDSRIFLAGWLMSADPDYPQEGNVSLKKLPDTAKDLYEYDVVILMDVDPAGFPTGFPALLESFVGKERGGLAYIAGSIHTPSLFESRDAEPLRGLLPIVPAARETGGEPPFHEKEWPLEPTPAALDHAATRLSSQIDRNRELWAEIAGIFGSFPALKAKPAATVLFIHPDPALARGGEPRPLVATQNYEGGRVLWCGIDSTWRWRATAEEVYDRFWIQTVRWLTESRLIGNRRRLIETDRESYELGEAFRISARIEDESYRPLEADEHPVEIQSPDGSTVQFPLRKDPALPGWFRGVFAPRMLGPHTIRLGPGLQKTEKVVSVDPPALEFQEPRLDEAALRELAALTGGSYAPLADILSVPERIPDRRQTIITTDEPIPLWDNWLSLSVLAGLLAVEWVLRKMNRLL